MKDYIIIVLTILMLSSCNDQKHPNDSLNKQDVFLFVNPLDSLLSQFMNENKNTSCYFVFIYRSCKGTILTFNTDNIDYQINNKIPPILVGQKNGKTLYFYTGIENLFKFDTIQNCTKDFFKRNGSHISKSYVIYDIDHHIELIKDGVPPYAPPPGKVIFTSK